MNKNIYLWTGLGAAFVVTLAAGSAAAAYGYETAYRDRFFGGISIAGLRIDGMTRSQAKEALQARVDRALEPGFRFRFGEDVIDLPRNTIAIEDPDLSQELIRYDVDPAIARAFLIGRGQGIIPDSVARFSLLLKRQDLPLKAELNKTLATNILRDEIDKHSSLAQDADVTVSYSSSTNTLEQNVISEHEGRSGDVTRAIETLAAQTERLAFQQISIQPTIIYPRITTQQVREALPRIQSFLGTGHITLTLDRKKYEVTTSTMAGWIRIVPSENGVTPVFDPARVATGLKPLVAELIVEPINGSLTLDTEGKFKDFIAPAEGILVDGEKTGTDVLAALQHGSSTAPLTLTHVTPDITGPDAERLGITKLLGVGRSNFSGSPSNRRRNIALGAKKVNGTLLAPGEVFSQLGVLGPVDGAHGWFQELVIKGNKTTPEYGGGLCQVGTTSFRAALAAGMPIVERANHSYRVVYYEPVGTDATIYDPAPDFKFKNDTPNNLLMTTQVQGDNLLFFVWGTPDGRVTSSTKSVAYNIVPPPAKKMVPTTDLPVGKIKCTESAHAGADASFDYAVAYANGTYKKQTFTSHYRPWGAVCLVGSTPDAIAAAANTTVDETGVNNPD